MQLQLGTALWICLLGFQSVADLVRQGNLRRFGHLQHKDVDDLVSACRNVEVAGVRYVGRYVLMLVYNNNFQCTNFVCRFRLHLEPSKQHLVLVVDVWYRCHLANRLNPSGIQLEFLRRRRPLLAHLSGNKPQNSLILITQNKRSSVQRSYLFVQSL